MGILGTLAFGPELATRAEVETDLRTDLFWFDELMDDGEPAGSAILLDTFDRPHIAAEFAQDARNWFERRYGLGDLVARPHASTDPEDTELILRLGGAPKESMFAGPEEDVAPYATDGRRLA